jgi:hypothetical protein
MSVQIETIREIQVLSGGRNPKPQVQEADVSATTVEPSGDVGVELLGATIAVAYALVSAGSPPAYTCKVWGRVAGQDWIEIAAWDEKAAPYGQSYFCGPLDRMYLQVTDITATTLTLKIAPCALEGT